MHCRMICVSSIINISEYYWQCPFFSKWNILKTILIPSLLLTAFQLCVYGQRVLFISPSTYSHLSRAKLGRKRQQSGMRKNEFGEQTLLTAVLHSQAFVFCYRLKGCNQAQTGASERKWMKKLCTKRWGTSLKKNISQEQGNRQKICSSQYFICYIVVGGMEFILFSCRRNNIIKKYDTDRSIHSALVTFHLKQHYFCWNKCNVKIFLS